LPSKPFIMSDLLPLFVAALKDKVVIDAQDEIVQQKKELDLLRSVQIIHRPSNEDEEIVVYASARFEDGCYLSNPNLWEVDLLEPKLGEKASTTTTRCRLTNLRQCDICVGGGFPIASFDDELNNRADYEGFFDYSDSDSDNSKRVSFCFGPYSSWVLLEVHGWPRADWADDTDPETVIAFLVDDVASRYPDATVEFKSVSFVVSSIHGALKRLLPPRRQAQVRADRDSRNTEESRAHSELMQFVAITMREGGNQNGSVLFVPQLHKIMDLLSQLGVFEQNEDNQNLIVAVVQSYEQNGRDVVEGAIRGIIRRRQQGGAAEGEDAIFGNDVEE